MGLSVIPDALELRLGSRFSIPEAERVRATVLALDPLPELTLDFSGVRELHDSAIAVLASTLRARPRANIVLRGLTTHHLRLLRYFDRDEPSASI